MSLLQFKTIRVGSGDGDNDTAIVSLDQYRAYLIRSAGRGAEWEDHSIDLSAKRKQSARLCRLEWWVERQSDVIKWRRSRVDFQHRPCGFDTVIPD